MGSCSEREDAPSIEMSENGKTILVFTPGALPVLRNSTDMGEVNTFDVQ
jgi:hypothetical protein